MRRLKNPVLFWESFDTGAFESLLWALAVDERAKPQRKGIRTSNVNVEVFMRLLFDKGGHGASRS